LVMFVPCLLVKMLFSDRLGIAVRSHARRQRCRTKPQTGRRSCPTSGSPTGAA